MLRERLRIIIILRHYYLPNFLVPTLFSCFSLKKNLSYTVFRAIYKFCVDCIYIIQLEYIYKLYQNHKMTLRDAWQGPISIIYLIVDRMGGAARGCC